MAMNQTQTSTHYKTQFYGGDGTGRDQYIFGDNGGFCPPNKPCKIEELGKGYILTAKISYHFRKFN
jgi:hypothetical protein